MRGKSLRRRKIKGIRREVRNQSEQKRDGKQTFLKEENKMETAEI